VLDRFVLQHFNVIRTVLALGIALVLAILLIVVLSTNPGFSLISFLAGPVSSLRTFGTVLEFASPIIFCGLAIAISFRAQVFYIGAEGAFYIAAAVGTAVAVSTALPWFLHVPLVLIVSATVGALWGGISGYLRAQFGASEIVSALMLNFVAYFLGLYLINYHFRDLDAGYMVSYTLPESAQLWRFVPGTRIHTGIVLGVLLAIAVYYFFFHTRAGYEVRMTGHNRKFAHFAGINTYKVVFGVPMLTGLLAGLGGMTEVMGIHERFNWQNSPGYGWDGVIVAIIGKNHPAYIVLASLLLAFLRVGGQQLKLMSDVPAELVLLIRSLMILLVTAEGLLTTWRNRIKIRQVAEGRERAEHA
jgi:simple sugar transport system permease protein